MVSVMGPEFDGFLLCERGGLRLEQENEAKSKNCKLVLLCFCGCPRPNVPQQLQATSMGQSCWLPSLCVHCFCVMLQYVAIPVH